MFPFPFQSEALRFQVQLPQFLRFLDSLGHAFGQRDALASANAGAMEPGDHIPPNVAFEIE